MATVIPSNNDAKVRWAILFKAQFAQKAASFNFSAEDVEKVASACDTIVFTVTLASRAKIFSSVCHSYRKLKLRGKNVSAEGLAAIPEFKSPEPPAVLFPSDAEGFLKKLIALIKLQPNYTETVGVGMGILTPKAARNDAEAFPKAKLKALDNSVVQIKWTKGKFDGVIVRSMRGDEETYKEIGRDNYSPYIDTRPPLEAGKPEVRRYQLLYMLEDKPVGQLSTIYEVVTNP